jgi:hypothetical protein
LQARKNPTPQQIMRRLRRAPKSEHDPRYENDGYYALRQQGYSHSYAKRAFRDEPPKIVKQEATPVADCDPDDILFPPGSTFTKIEVAVRPPLTELAVASASSRASEYTIWDHEISGFGLRVRPSGYKCFVFYYRLGGKLKKITLGRAGNWTLEAARQAAREYLYRLHNEAGAVAQASSTDDVETE